MYHVTRMPHLCISALYTITIYNIHGALCIGCAFEQVRHLCDLIYVHTCDLLIVIMSHFSFICVICLIHMCGTIILLHLECHPILISNLNLTGFFSTARGKKDPEN